MSSAASDEPPTKPPSSNNPHKKRNIRHAEKRRTSTCDFADRIARLSVNHYKACLQEQASPLTCIATIVAHDASDDALRVLSMGVGTKFLKVAQLHDDHPYGSRLRDMHAEILCQRAFKRYLMLEIRHHLQHPMEVHQNSILRSITSSEATPQFVLKSCVTLHFYCSSVPCGNASLKKFVKMQKEVFQDLPENKWPLQEHAPSEFGSSQPLGELALLLKKDPTTKVKEEKAAGSDGDDDDKASEKHKRPRRIAGTNPQSTSTQASSKPLKKLWPCQETDDWCPPGTIPAFSSNVSTASSIHTCSDKLCRWNILGLQGALLSAFTEETVYMSSLTVGRKLSNATCRRAVCCRLEERAKKKRNNSQNGWQPPPSFQQQLDQAINIKLKNGHGCDGHSDSIHATSNDNTVAVTATTLLTSSYRIHHPAVMGTAVHLDDTAVVETSSAQQGQDVRFHSPYVWAWWASGFEIDRREGNQAADGSRPTHFVNSGILECIDGTSGYLAADSATCGGDDDKYKQDDTASRPPPVSFISTQSLTSLFLKTLSLSNHNNQNKYKDRSSPLSSSFSTLAELSELKASVSPTHEAAKNFLFSHHRVLREWNRRQNAGLE